MSTKTPIYWYQLTHLIIWAYFLVTVSLDFDWMLNSEWVSSPHVGAIHAVFTFYICVILSIAVERCD